jgi:hypothetical protein
MLRNMTLLSLVVLGLSLFAFAEAADTAPTLVLPICSELIASRNTQACASVRLLGRGARIASVGFTVVYDTNVMRLPGHAADVKKGAVLTGGQALSAEVTEDVQPGIGRAKVTITPPIQFPIPVLSDGEIAQVCFTVEPAAPFGCTALAIAPVDMGDDQGNELVVEPPVTGGAQISAPPPTPTFTPTAAVTLTPTATMTPATITPTLTVAATVTPTHTAILTPQVITTPTATSTPSGGKDAQKCQRTIVKAAAGFVQAKTNALQKCEHGKVKGKIVSCPTLKASDAIAHAEAKLQDSIAKACCGKDKHCTGDGDDQTLVDIGWDIGSCPNFENGTCTNQIMSATSVASCLGCIGEAAVDQAIGLYYGSLHPSDPKAEKALNKCQQTIGKAAATFLIAKSKALQKCWDTVTKGKAFGACPAAVGKAQATIAVAEAKMVGSICKACGGGGDNKPADGRCDTGGGLAPEAIGFPPICPALQTPEGGDCGGGGAIDTLDRLIACIACVTEFKVDCADRSAVPGFIQYPQECNP